MKLKTIYCIIFIACTNFIYGQDSIITSEKDTFHIRIMCGIPPSIPPEFYVDDIQIDLERIFIHEKNIKTIEVFKEIRSGVVIIKRKKQYDFVTLSAFVNDIKKENKKLNELTQIIVNGQLIEHPADYGLSN